MKIDIEDIACIENCTVKIPDNEPGGVLVFRARNGGGKTSAINIVNALVTGTGKLIPHDDAAKGQATLVNGEAKAKITAGGTTRRTGDAEIPNLEGRFDFADLVDPREKSAEAREKKRIKALVGLNGVKADPSIYYSLVGGKEPFESYVSVDELKTDDAVELAGRVQRAFHAAAKKYEDLAKHAEGHATVAKATAEGVDMSSPDDSKQLENQLIDAVAKQTTLEQQRTAWALAQQAASGARALLEKHDNSKSLAAAKADYDAAQEKHNAAWAAEQAAKKVLDAAQKAFDEAAGRTKEAKADVLAKEGVLKGCEQTAAATKGWKKTIDDAAGLANPSDEEIEAAKVAAAKAREAITLGAVVRRAKEQIELAGKHEADAKENATKAESLREAARSVDTVLSGLIPAGKLRVRKGVVVLDTERGENSPYEECSEGERVSVALSYAINAVGEGGIICLPQPHFEGLDPANRKALAMSCRAAGVWIVTGEASTGDLRAEIYGE